MVFSYYESSLLKLAKENNIDLPRPSKIAEKYGITLDDENLKISRFLFETISPLRNQLCHNNSGTLFEKSSQEEIEKIKKLAQKGYISIVGGRIIVESRDFIKQILDGEYKVLIKLADICGYKTKFLGSKK